MYSKTITVNIFIIKTNAFFALLWKNPSENETAFAIGGRLTAESVHALCVCVFVCIPLFELN